MGKKVDELNVVSPLFSPWSLANFCCPCNYYMLPPLPRLLGGFSCHFFNIQCSCFIFLICFTLPVLYSTYFSTYIYVHVHVHIVASLMVPVTGWGGVALPAKSSFSTGSLQKGGNFWLAARSGSEEVDGVCFCYQCIHHEFVWAVLVVHMKQQRTHKGCEGFFV